MSLSDSFLRNINGKHYIGKSELPDRDGLSARITKNGTITFQYRFRFKGKMARLDFGRYPDLKIAGARKLISEVRQVLSEGVDPRVYLKSKRHKVEKITVRYCCEQFLAIREPTFKISTIGTYKSIFKEHLYPAFEDREIENISLSEWIDFFDKISQKSRVTSGAVLKLLKAICNWCVRRQLISTLDVQQLRTVDIGSFAKKGTRVLTTLECGKIWRELDRSRASPSVTNSIKACMLTGARISEILKSKMKDFDLESMIWTVPSENSKMNLPIRRPITPAFLEVLDFQWRLYQSSEWTFPAPNDFKKHLGIASANKLVREIKPRIDIPDWRTHDFRRTISTRLSEVGVLPHVTEKMLGHVLGGVMSVYNKHDWLSEQAKAYRIWSDKLMLSVKGDSKVAVFEQRA